MYEVKRLERVAHSLSVSSNLNTKMLDFEKEWIAECVAQLQIEVKTLSESAGERLLTVKMRSKEILQIFEVHFK